MCLGLLQACLHIYLFIYLFILLRLGVTYIKNIEDNYKTRQGHHNSKNQLLWAQITVGRYLAEMQAALIADLASETSSGFRLLWCRLWKTDRRCP